jgi:hypothetical protein
MRPFARRFLPLLAAAVTFVLVSTGGAQAAIYRWSKTTGGAWDDGTNWSPTGYPHLFFDFAMFDSPGFREVDATRADRVPGVAGIMVTQSDVCLRAHSALQAVVSVGTQTAPASLTLRSGGIFANAVHTVGGRGTLVLEPGTRLESRVTGTVGFQLDAGGTLRGDGGSLERQTLRSFGTVSPGLASGATGVLYLGLTYPAGYVQRETGVLEIDLAGPDPGSGYDRLEVVRSGAPIVLGGTLRVRLLDGYIPDPQSDFAIVVAPAINGAFAAVELPSVARREFSLVVTPTQVIVHVEGPRVIAAHLDVHPADCPNSVGVKSHGVIPMALVGDTELNVEGVDRASLLLEGIAPLRSALEDVAAPSSGEECDCSDAGADGVLDLTLKFSAEDVLAAIGSGPFDGAVPVTLTGTLLDGTPFEATDCLRLVGTGKPAAAIWPASAPGEAGQRVTASVAAAGPATIGVFDVSGRQVATVWSGDLSAGEQTLGWNASGLSSGIYFYVLESPSGSARAKLLLLR